jgi:cell division protein FtsN
VSPKARYTLQIAAYKSRTEAEALVKKLVARGMDARVVELSKLYRVRVGKYVTREGALAAQRELKAKKITTVLTDIEPAGK